MMLKRLRDFYFAIDLRSLALFRILFGVLLIHDWFVRWPNIEAFYTSFGFLPIEAPLPKAGGDFHFSLLDGFTSVPMVRFVFLLALPCYVSFLLGYRTKLVHVLSFLFFVSVSNRNIIIRHGGDVVTLTMLMWTLFLPLGRRFSLDAVIEAMRRGVDLRRRPDVSQPQLCTPSLAAFCAVCQIGLVYFMTAYAKFGETWVNGTALYYALELDQFAKPFGQWMASRPLWIMQTLTWGALWIEFAAVPFLFLPFPQPFLRRILICILVAMHLGIWLTLDIGSFPFVMIATYALLLRPEDWALIRRVALRWSRPVVVYYDDTCGFCYRCSQLLAIADRANHIRFIGSTNRAAWEHDLKKEEVESSIVVFDIATQERTSRAAGAAAIVRALPLPFHLFRAIAWPWLRLLSNAVYDWVARNRYRVSEWLGFQACGLARVSEDTGVEQPELTPLARVSRSFLAVLANLGVAVIFICVLVDSYNINMTERRKRPKLTEPRWMQAVIQAPQLVHDWYLFAPNPITDDGWWVIDGVTLSGRRLDPLTGELPMFDKPTDIPGRFDPAWRKYLYRIWLKDFYDYRLYFCKYITRKHHRDHPSDRLDHFRFYYVREDTQPPGTPKPWPAERVFLWKHDCFHGDPKAPKNRPPQE
jgi:predicted DCC family thiol-disulfide oxidoreductase YuxK